MPNITGKCFSCVWTKCAYYYISFCYCEMSSLKVRNFILEICFCGKNMIGYRNAWHIHMYIWRTLLHSLKTANWGRNTQILTKKRKICFCGKNMHGVLFQPLAWHDMVWYGTVWQEHVKDSMHAELCVNEALRHFEYCLNSKKMREKKVHAQNILCAY